MPGAHNFEHLPLLLRYQGKARLRGGGDPSPQTLANKGAQRQAHSVALDTAAQALSQNWQARKAQRLAAGLVLPDIPAGIPILLQIDTGLDLDALRAKFATENRALELAAQQARVDKAEFDAELGRRAVAVLAMFLGALTGAALQSKGHEDIILMVALACLLAVIGMMLAHAHSTAAWATARH